MRYIFILFFTSIITAQTSEIGIGLRSGADISYIQGNIPLVTKSKSGFYIGVFKEIKLLGDILILQPEVQYSQQGFKIDNIDKDIVDVNYIKIPVLVKVYLPFIKIISLETGPHFSFKTSQKSTIAISSFKNYETNWAFGGSIYLIPSIGLSINTRYIVSFDTVSKEIDAKNGLVQIGLALQI